MKAKNVSRDDRYKRWRVHVQRDGTVHRVYVPDAMFGGKNAGFFSAIAERDRLLSQLKEETTR